jgi:hypothetical protein
MPSEENSKRRIHIKNSIPFDLSKFILHKPSEIMFQFHSIELIGTLVTSIHPEALFLFSNLRELILHNKSTTLKVEDILHTLDLFSSKSDINHIDINYKYICKTSNNLNMLSKYTIKSLTLANDGEEDDFPFIINQLENFNSLSQLQHLRFDHFRKETLDSAIYKYFANLQTLVL